MRPFSSTHAVISMLDLLAFLLPNHCNLNLSKNPRLITETLGEKHSQSSQMCLHKHTGSRTYYQRVTRGEKKRLEIPFK